MMKKLLGLLTLFVVGVLMSTAVFAAASINLVRVDGTTVTQSSTNMILDVERGENIPVKVTITPTTNMDDVEIEVVLRGVDSNDKVEDITDVFDAKAGVTYVKTLSLPLIQKMDQDRYLLRVRVTDRDSATVEQTYSLEIDTKRHDVEVRDIVLSPNTEVKAGRALLATVRLRNRGEEDQDGVKVVVSIPELGVSASDFVDELEREDDDDDQATTEEMFLRIPDNAKTGEYTVKVEVFFDDGDKKNVKETKILVLADDSLQGKPSQQDKTIIAVGADAQSVQRAGAEVAYPLTLTNSGTSSKTYIVSADGASWATFRISPSNVVVVGAGESKAVTVYVKAKDNAPVGAQTFSVSISSDDKVLKQLAFSANVAEKSGASQSKRGLEVGLVVLVILLVIIGLIIGFSKLRGDDEENDKEKTYY